MSDTTPVTIVEHGPSRSFPEGDPFLARSVPDAPVVVHVGTPDRSAVDPAPTATCTLIELGGSSLGAFTGEEAGDEGDTRVGFARWRLGDDPPSPLVELVVQPATSPDAITAAIDVFTSAGLEVSVCQDRVGRILDRLLRPYFNDALRALDDGVASGPDLDKTVRLGLGYPEGPIALLLRSGLHHHHDVTKQIHAVTGTVAFAPPRRAVVAAERQR